MRKAIIIMILFSFVFLATSYRTGVAESAESSETPLYGQGANDMAVAIVKRTRELDDRELAVRLEEEKLKSLKLEVEEKVGELKIATAALEALLSQFGEADKEKIIKLAKVYESMPPEEAATRVEKLEKDLAVRLLKNIKSRQAGKIMAFIEPTIAADLSERFSQSALPKGEL